MPIRPIACTDCHVALAYRLAIISPGDELLSGPESGTRGPEQA